MATEAIPETSKSCTRGVASCGHQHEDPPRRGLSIAKCAQNSAKSCSGNQSQESAVDDEMSRSADRNRHFAEMRTTLHVSERLFHLVERKSLVDDRLHAACRDGVRHRLEILDRSDREALQALLVHDHQGQPRVRRRWPGEHADERDRTADPGRPDRFIQGADAANLDDQVDAVAAPLAGFLSPVGCCLVVQCEICAELPEAFDLGVAGGGRDDARAAHLRKLNGEEGHAAGALRQDGLAGFYAAEFYHRAPGRDPGAGQCGGFDIAEVLRRSNQRVLWKETILGENAAHRAAEGRAHLRFAGLAADPAFEETADDAVVAYKFPYARADPLDHARTV